METNSAQSPINFISRLYESNEEACFAYHPNGRDHVYPVLDACDWAKYVALNPHAGRRLDQNVTAMRNLLIQVEDPALARRIASAFPWTSGVQGPSGTDFIASLAQPASNSLEYRVLLSALASYCLSFGHFAMKGMNPSQLTMLPRSDQAVILLGDRVPREVFNQIDIYHQLQAGLMYATGGGR